MQSLNLGLGVRGLGVRGSFFKHRFSPISARNILVRDHTVAVILLRVVRPLYVRCQPDRQTPLHRHVLHQHGAFTGNGNSVKSGIRRNWDNVPFSDAFYKLLFPRRHASAPCCEHAWMDITHITAELLGPPRALGRPQTPIPAALWHLGPAACG